jgi:hypothetical protein
MLAELDSHTRSIRNIQIVRQDLFPLVAAATTAAVALDADTSLIGILVFAPRAGSMTLVQLPNYTKSKD